MTDADSSRENPHEDSPDCLREELPEKAAEMYDYLMENGFSAKVAAAGAAYHYGRFTKHKSSQKVIGDYFGVTAGAVSRAHRVLSRHNPTSEELYKSQGLFSDDLPAGFLESLPRRAEDPDKKTKTEIVNDIKSSVGLETANKSHLNKSELREIIGEDDMDSIIESLEQDYEFEFGKGEDAKITVNISISRDGMWKLHNKVVDDR